MLAHWRGSVDVLVPGQQRSPAESFNAAVTVKILLVSERNPLASLVVLYPQTQHGVFIMHISRLDIPHGSTHDSSYRISAHCHTFSTGKLIGKCSQRIVVMQRPAKWPHMSTTEGIGQEVQPKRISYTPH
jgi:hypothetical protein